MSANHHLSAPHSALKTSYALQMAPSGTCRLVEPLPTSHHAHSPGTLHHDHHLDHAGQALDSGPHTGLFDTNWPGQVPRQGRNRTIHQRRYCTPFRIPPTIRSSPVGKKSNYVKYSEIRKIIESRASLSTAIILPA